MHAHSASCRECHTVPPGVQRNNPKPLGFYSPAVEKNPQSSTKATVPEDRFSSAHLKRSGSEKEIAAQGLAPARVGVALWETEEQTLPVIHGMLPATLDEGSNVKGFTCKQHVTGGVKFQDDMKIFLAGIFLQIICYAIIQCLVKFGLFLH